MIQYLYKCFSNKKYEMAQKQGKDENFTYYTLDNEFSSHRPHVHVCVSKNDKHWKGSSFNNGNNLQSVGAVFLPYEQIKNKVPFTIDNIEFEIIDDKRVENIKYKKVICDWLNSEMTDSFGNKILNAMKCFNDYKLSNGDSCIYLKKLKLN